MPHPACEVWNLPVAPGQGEAWRTSYNNRMVFACGTFYRTSPCYPVIGNTPKSYFVIAPKGIFIMLIYLASRYSRYKEMQQVRADLEQRGHQVTSRWINGDHQISDSGLSDAEREKERIRFACEDLRDLERSDTIISFTEPPRSTNSRGGRHVELGIAIGLCKRTVVVGPRENVFHCLPSVMWFPDYSSFLNGFSESALNAMEFGIQPITSANQNASSTSVSPAVQPER